MIGGFLAVRVAGEGKATRLEIDFDGRLWDIRDGYGKVDDILLRITS